MKVRRAKSSLPNYLLHRAGAQRGVRGVAGKVHPLLQTAANQQAQYQASRGVQGHQGWDHRRAALAEQLPSCRTITEVCAESWPWNSLEEAADEMFNSWQQSDGHWKTVNGDWTYFGLAMALNEKQNIWYATSIFAKSL